MCRQSQIKGLLICIVTHTLAQIWACGHSSQAFVREVRARLLIRYPWLDFSEKSSDSWRKMWAGHPVRPWRMQQLAEVEPGLLRILNDPLWQVLHVLWEERRPSNALAHTLYQACFDGRPLRCETAMRRLFDCPAWCHLSIALALLGSDSDRMIAMRKWLQRDFFSYLLLICMQEPGCYVRARLYEVLDALILRHMIPPIFGWPADVAGFLEECQAMESFGQWLKEQGGSDGWSSRTCTLVHLKWPDRALRDFVQGDGTVDYRVSITCQDKRRVDAACARHRLLAPYWRGGVSVPFTAFNLL